MSEKEFEELLRQFDDNDHSEDEDLTDLVEEFPQVLKRRTEA